MKLCAQCKQRYPDESSFCFVDGSSLDPAEDARLGNVVSDRYSLETIVGVGRYATVFRAIHELSGRVFALKIFGGGSAENAASIRQPHLSAELRVGLSQCQRLAHHNLVTHIEEGQIEDGSVFSVTELVRGETLASVLAKGKLPVQRALVLTVQIARGLSRAHDLAVVHGDLKPANVFVLKGDHVKIGDLAIARAGEPLRTPAYRAPGPLGPSGDIYSLGMILFQMLTGSLPPAGPDAPPPRLSEKVQVPPALDALVFSMMAQTPMGRPVDAHAVIRAVVAIASQMGAGLPEPPEGAVPPLPPVEFDPTQVQTKWEQRAKVFAEMVRVGFPQGAPPHVSKAIEELDRGVRELGEIRSASAEILRTLDIVDQEGIDSLMRLGEGMSTIMVDASSVREEVRALGGAIGPELAGRLSDIDYQVKDLRGSLEAVSADLKERRSHPRAELGELSRRWTDVEANILSVAARFCAPLRARPELSQLFSKLR